MERFARPNSGRLRARDEDQEVGHLRRRRHLARARRPPHHPRRGGGGVQRGGDARRVGRRRAGHYEGPRRFRRGLDALAGKTLTRGSVHHIKYFDIYSLVAKSCKKLVGGGKDRLVRVEMSRVALSHDCLLQRDPGGLAQGFVDLDFGVPSAGWPLL